MKQSFANMLRTRG